MGIHVERFVMISNLLEETEWPPKVLHQRREPVRDDERLTGCASSACRSRAGRSITALRNAVTKGCGRSNVDRVCGTNRVPKKKGCPGNSTTRISPSLSEPLLIPKCHGHHLTIPNVNARWLHLLRHVGETSDHIHLLKQLISSQSLHYTKTH